MPLLGWLGIGVELKPSYYRRAVRNLEAVETEEFGQLEFEVGDGELSWAFWAEGGE